MNTNKHESAFVRSCPEMSLTGSIREHSCSFVAKILNTRVEYALRIASQTDHHPGIAFSHKDTVSTGQIIRSLVLIYEVLDPEEMVGRIEFL